MMKIKVNKFYLHFLLRRFYVYFNLFLYGLICVGIGALMTLHILQQREVSELQRMTSELNESLEELGDTVKEIKNEEWREYVNDELRHHKANINRILFHSRIPGVKEIE